MQTEVKLKKSKYKCIFWTNLLKAKKRKESVVGCENQYTLRALSQFKCFQLKSFTFDLKKIIFFVLFSELFLHRWKVLIEIHWTVQKKLKINYISTFLGQTYMISDREHLNWDGESSQYLYQHVYMSWINFRHYLHQFLQT